MNLSKNMLLGSLVFGASLLGASTAGADTIALACTPTGINAQLCQQAGATWGEKSGHTVNLVSLPATATEIQGLYQQILAAGGSDIDVYQIDVIWPGLLATHMVDLKPYVEDVIGEHFEAIVKNNTVGDKLVGLPWYTDAGLLYFRTDLLEKYGEEPPTTWEQLTAAAKKIQDGEREAGHDKFWGFVWQGRAYEGLTCDALEWVYSHKGGTIVEPDGKISINNPKAVEALELAKSWVGTITPDGVLNYAEEEARGVFQVGDAAFMRNWPYAWALAQGADSVIKDKVGVSALPKGGEDGQHAGTLGGWQLAVSKYSKNVDAAADLAKYLTGKEEQKRRAIEGAYNPTLESLYEDEELLEANPFMGDLYQVFVNAVPRPSTVTGDKYPQVSSEFYNAVHAVLTGSKGAEQSLADLEKSLMRMSRGGRW